MTTKPSVIGNSLFYAVQLNAHDKELVPFSMQSPSDVFCLFIDTDKQETKNSLRLQRLQKAKQKEFQIIVLYGVSVGLLTNNDSTEKPAHNTSNRKAKTSETVVL